MAAELQEPSRPQNSYWIWLSEHREELAKEAGSGKGSVVGKLAGEKWKVLSANAKKPYEEMAAKKKADYEKAMEEFKAAGGQAGKRRQEKAALKTTRADKKAKKEDRKNSGKPAKPPAAYFAWLNAEGREAAQRELGTKALGVVTKAAAERWKTLSAAKKQPYEKAAAESKAKYDAAMQEWRAQQTNKENAADGDEEEEEAEAEEDDE